MIHKMINASAVACGLRPRYWYETSNLFGWDFGNISVRWSEVTCRRCLVAEPALG